MIVCDGMKKRKKDLILIGLIFVIWLLIFLFSTTTLMGSYTSETQILKQAKSLIYNLEFLVLILISIVWFYTYAKYKKEKNPIN